jgi:hypothetical protein
MAEPLNETAVPTSIPRTSPPADRPARRRHGGFILGVAALTMAGLLGCLTGPWEASQAVSAAEDAPQDKPMRERWTARALLHVALRPERILEDRRQDRQLESQDFHDYCQVVLMQLKNPTVLKAALRNPKVAALESVKKQGEPMEWLAQRILTDFNVAPEILRISMTGNNPKEVKILVDAVQGQNP